MQLAAQVRLLISWNWRPGAPMVKTCTSEVQWRSAYVQADVQQTCDEVACGLPQLAPAHAVDDPGVVVIF